MFAVTGNGSLLAWGQNAAGQLGNGSNQASAVPVEAVPSLGEPVTQVSAGTDHACAVTAAGNVFCWGANDVGQLGNGQTAASFTPSRVALPVAATAVACGGSHSCALADGGLYCWGENPWGELGNGTNTASPTPVPVTGLSSGVLSVAAALNVTCAVLTGGDLQCWGADPDGLLGDGNGAVVAAGLDPSAIPAQVTRLTSGVAQVSIGSTHGCALTTDGGVLCWGQNFFGDLGDGNTDAQSAPIQVTGLHSGIGAIAVGTRHACALTVDAGAVLCWGLGAEGQMGNGASIEKNLQPAASVSGLSGASALAAGDDVTCALVGGAVDCWGYGGEGALGNGGLANALVPGPVAAP